jgi:hypothetical protein
VLLSEFRLLEVKAEVSEASMELTEPFFRWRAKGNFL